MTKIQKVDDMSDAEKIDKILDLLVDRSADKCCAVTDDEHFGALLALQYVREEAQKIVKGA